MVVGARPLSLRNIHGLSRIALGAPVNGRPECEGVQWTRGAGLPDVIYCLNQSTTFHVGPTWVGFAKKLPSTGPTRSTFLR